MPLEPKIAPRATNSLRQCTVCGDLQPAANFAPIHSPLYPSNLCPICNTCAAADLRKNDFNWDYIDRLCRAVDLPFIPQEVERVRASAGDDNFWPTYARIFAGHEYESIGWDYYHKQFVALRDAHLIEDELPLIRDKKLAQLRRDWGSNYDDEQLYYLEDLYRGIQLTQNVNGALSIDQSRKLCRLSLLIDESIQGGVKDIDKYLSAYDRIVKAAEFTPKNAKNINDFDSFSEAGAWLEKRGFVNKFYDGATRDVIDETLKNLETWTQRLYVNEGGIGDEINERLEQLKATAQMEENYFDAAASFDPDQYAAEVFGGAEAEEFDFTGDPLNARNH